MRLCIDAHRASSKRGLEGLCCRELVWLSRVDTNDSAVAASQTLPSPLALMGSDWMILPLSAFHHDQELQQNKSGVA
jgi:hypothetical protein